MGRVDSERSRRLNVRLQAFPAPERSLRGKRTKPCGDESVCGTLCSSGVFVAHNPACLLVTFLFGVALILVLGVGAQWLAWHYQLPSILLLLVAGFLAGPVFGLIDPAVLQGEWVYPFVSISIGIILFEGGLNLRLKELREEGGPIINLITIGVLVTWILGTGAVYLIEDFGLELSLLTGAILVVTGPTVVMPLLRDIRPKGRIGAIAKWEGITIDPVGASRATRVREVILLLNAPGTASAGAVEATLQAPA
jgi:NhaP-type Na+/H+ or K+/H+ antiporter